VAPDAKIDDGFFDFLLLRRVPKLKLLEELIKIYRGAHVGDREVLIKKAKKLVIEPANEGERIPVEYDGELGKTLPIEYTLVPSSVKIKI